MKAFLKEAYHRFSAETPAFFKKIVRGGIAIGGAGAGLKTITASGVVLPHFLTMHADHMIAIGAVTALIAKLACASPDSLPVNSDPGQPK